MIFVIKCTRAPREIDAWRIVFHFISQFSHWSLTLRTLAKTSTRPQQRRQADAMIFWKWKCIKFVRRNENEMPMDRSEMISANKNNRNFRYLLPMLCAWYCFWHRSRLSCLLWEISLSAFFVELFFSGNVWSTSNRSTKPTTPSLVPANACSSFEKSTKLCLAASKYTSITTNKMFRTCAKEQRASNAEWPNKKQKKRVCRPSTSGPKEIHTFRACSIVCWNIDIQSTRLQINTNCKWNEKKRWNCGKRTRNRQQVGTCAQQ